MGKVIDQPILGLYWTLTLEVMFYISVSLLFLVKLNEKSLSIALIMLGLSVLNGVTIGKAFGIAFYFATFFIGTMFYRYWAHQAKRSTTLFVLLTSIVSIIAITSFVLLGKDDPNSMGTHSFLPVTSAWIGAYLFFWIGLLFSKSTMPKGLTYLGKISYSIYLMQAIVLLVVPPNYMLTIFVSTIIFSMITYHFIEEPFINIGRRKQPRNQLLTHKEELRPD